jgi:hypothetical protein
VITAIAGRVVMAVWASVANGVLAPRKRIHQPWEAEEETEGERADVMFLPKDLTPHGFRATTLLLSS